MRRPKILVTVYRRYHELRKNLARVRERCLAELGFAPEVTVVWACPELGRLWVFDELREAGLLKQVLGRPPLEHEPGCANTTYTESHNIRLGLSALRREAEPGDYFLVMAADVYLQDGAVDFVNHHMNCGNEAVVFHWPNSVVHEGIWHTNFFAVGADERYWPPVSTVDDQDCLERQWGIRLAQQALPGVHRWHNYNERKFLHRHESENLPDVPRVGLPAADSACLATRGRCPWWRRLLRRLGFGVSPRREGS